MAHMTRDRAINLGLSIATVVAICGIWEASSRLGWTRPAFLPGLSAILTESVRLTREGELFAPLALSLYRAAGGLLWALIIGVPLGFAMARTRGLDWFFSPLVAVGMPAPKITLLPVFILWFGIDSISKIILVAFTCVFPIVVAAREGAKTVPTTQIWAALAMGTNRGRLLLRIILPAALPSLLSGVRVSIPLALLTAFTAEMVGGGGGIGGLLTTARRLFETPTVFVYIIVMGIVGYVLDAAFLLFRQRVLHWNAEHSGKT